MASQVTLKALGLNYSPNNLALPEGSLIVANDVIVRRDNVVESRRGFKDYSVGLGISTNPIKQLLEYKSRILAHYNNKLAYDTQVLNSAGRNIFADFSGTYNETQTGLRIKSIDANKNLYFTTSDGIKKLSVKTSADLANASIINAGAVKALDINAELDFQQGQLSGFLPVDSTVAYRVLWGYKDANDNTILGAPSDRVTLYNYLSDVLPLDLNTLLLKLDILAQSVAISNVSIANPTTITTSTAHGLASGDIVNITGTNTSASTLGSFVATVTGATTFTIPVNVTAVTTVTGTLTKSLISDGNYYNTYQTSIEDDAQILKDNVVNLATKLDTDLLFADNAGGGTPYVPLKMNTVQIDTGSVGQVNFSSSPSNYFVEGDKIKVEGFTTEPVTTNLSLTNVGGTSLSPENPASIAYTGSSTITNGQNITITGANTSASINGTFTATVATNTISTTTGPAIVGFTTISTATTTITTSSAHGLVANSAFYVTGTGVSNFNNGTYYVLTAPAGNTMTVSATLGGPAITPASNSSSGQLVRQVRINTAGISTATTTITTSAVHGLSANDAFYISGTGVSNFDNGIYYVLTTPATNTLTVSTTRGGSAITPTSNSGTGIIIPELTVNTSAAHSISIGNYVNISGANAVAGVSGNINQNWFVSNGVSGTTSFKVAPTASIMAQANAGTVRKTTIPVNVSSVTTGTGNIAITTGNNLKLFNNTFTISKVDGTSNYIQFTIPDNTITYTATAIDSTAKLYSYNYRNIVNTGDDTYSVPLANLIPSIPATSQDLRLIQNNVLRIADRLKVELNGVINTTLQNSSIAPYNITSSSNAKITVTIPDGIDNNYFYQVYRTRIFTAEGSQTLGSTGSIPVTPDDEMRLVYEAFPPNISAPSVTFIDSYPEDLALTNENLYTNPVTGEGIENANDIPPFAKDINVFKNTTFFANTKTRQRLNPFQLLGTSNIGGANDDRLTIGNSNGSITYIFNPGVQQEVKTIFTSTDSAPTIKGNIQNRYIVLNTPSKQYYAWFRYDNQNITFSNVVPSGSITTFTTSVNHNLASGSKIILSGLSSVVDVNGEQTITVTGLNTFTIPTNCGIVSSFAVAFAIPTVTDAIPIQVDLTSSDIPSICGSKLANSIASIANDFVSTNLLEISGITPATPNTTINTSTIHGLSPGNVVIIQGVTQTGGTAINGTVTVVGTPTTTSFTIATASLPTGVTFTSATVSTYIVYTTNIDEGIATAPTTNVLGSITNTVTVTGDGEDATANPPKVLLSQVASRGQAIDETARSLARVINQQANSNVYAYYISGESTSPGIINLEAKTLSEPTFYVVANGNGVGESFNPDISPSKEISGAGVITGTIGSNVFTLTSPAHGLNNTDQIIISGSNCNPIIDGVYSVSGCTINTFNITFTSTFLSAGTYFAYSKLTEASSSTNEEKPNRIYYSKTSQPEAVPILNYLNAGSENKAILRIFPIRDSLFVFKEDGLFRISGEEPPFVLSLFDSSCILAAPDSVDVSNNIIYGWTTKGISNISESGVTEISRPIDTEILKLASAQFPNFKTITWGVGYDSDNSYTVFTNSDPSDIIATVGFRYSDLTNSWTNIIRTENCGLIAGFDDRMYVGGGEDNIVHQERKSFTRSDYADEDFFLSIANGAIENNGSKIYFPSVSDIDIGDSIVQEQILTNILFNAFLAKLDLDPTVGVNVITGTSGASTTITVNTSAPHGMLNGDYVVLSNTDSVPSIDGTYQIGGVTGSSFNITVSTPLTTQATTGDAKRSYELTLSAVNGDSLRDKIEDLALYLDSDPGLVFTDYFNKITNHSGSVLSNSAANPTVVTASAPHNLIDGRLVTFAGVPVAPVSIPSLDDQTYTVDNTGTFGVSTTFTVPVTVTTAGSSGLTFDTSPNLLNMLDIQACFNGLVDNVNNDPGATFNNYKTVTDSTLIEAIVTFVDKYNNFVEVNLSLPWTTGMVTVYKAIPCKFIYAPITFGDPLSIKQIYEATIMFDNKAFTKATASFGTDIKPEFLSVDFFGQGNGIFGHYSNPGFGYGFFGGLSNSAPFRTIIPRQCQRGRYLNVGYEHRVAREKWALNGITLTGNVSISTKGYR